MATAISPAHAKAGYRRGMVRPAMQARLPPLLASTCIVGLDCGFGWFCHWTTTHHALSVPGLDLSENVLARACELGHDPIITYARQDMETLDLPAGAFDLTYSSLVLHYTAILARGSQSFMPVWCREVISYSPPDTQSTPPLRTPTGYRAGKAPVSGHSMTTSWKTPAPQTGRRSA